MTFENASSSVELVCENNKWETKLKDITESCVPIEPNVNEICENATLPHINNTIFNRYIIKKWIAF